MLQRAIDNNVREELAAFIAGELAPARAAVWEYRLASEPSLRAELTALRQTWETLDFLEMPSPSPQFAERTTQLATSALPLMFVAESEPISNGGAASRPAPRGWTALAWGVAFVAAVFVGNAAIGHVPDRRAEFLRALPVVERFDEYRAVPSFEFLRQLHDKKSLDNVDEFKPFERRWTKRQA